MEVMCIGNGQVDQLKLNPLVGALNCMHDQQAIIITDGGGEVLSNESKEPILLESNQNHATVQTNGVSTALPAAMGEGGGYVPMIAKPIDASYYKGCGERNGEEREVVTAVDCRNATENADVNGALQSESRKNLNSNSVCRTQQTVRRLVPEECVSLQGFPRGWVDIGEWTDSKGKTHKDSDSAKYKALGNSIAVGYANKQSGFWCWLARRICAQYERQITMGSLFDGISGFPLSFAAAGSKPVFSSEIEEYPIAVAKKHFGDEDTGKRGDIHEILAR